MALVPGSRLGPYEILAAIGAGGMGEVYRARDTRLNRDVAIKVIAARLADSPDALARFEREARAVAALAHPNILALHDVGVADGISYAVTELLDGESLRDVLRTGALPPRRSVRARDIVWLALAVPLLVAVAVRPRESVLGERLFARRG